jgi:ribosome-binding protein aMBF1 (putative translation factor)
MNFCQLCGKDIKKESNKKIYGKMLIVCRGCKYGLGPGVMGITKPVPKVYYEI